MNELHTPQSVRAESRARTDWMAAGRFGMFVHFGLYSMAARHEWVQSLERIAPDEYARYARHFDPDRFDARSIVHLAKSAGMTYAVLTTKHHDGFCLFDSALSDFTSVQACGRDLVREFVEACRSEGLRVGLYHSLIDWHHPDFTLDYHHPLRDAARAHELNAGRDMARYRAYLHGQVRELLTQYGQIDYLFFDFSYEQVQDGWAGKSAADWGAEELVALIRSLQPTVVINDRLGTAGDVRTPEQYQPDSSTFGDTPTRLAWEACQTLNGSWGYHRDNRLFKTTDLLLRMLVDAVAQDGNMLLNIGPDGRGAVTDVDRATLEGLGDWMALNGRAIHGAGSSQYLPPAGTVYTQRGDRLYVHVLNWPLGYLHLPGLAGKVEYAQLLCDGSELTMVQVPQDQQAYATQPGGQPAGTLSLVMPPPIPGAVQPVIELFLTHG